MKYSRIHTFQLLAEGVIKTRSLLQQFNYIISKNCHFGADKRADKKNTKVDTKLKIYSIKNAENLRHTAQNLCNYIKTEFPEIKNVNQIKAEHISAWYNARCKNWSKKTLECHSSYIRKLESLAKITYSTCKEDFSKAKLPDTVNYNAKKVRDIQMSEADFRKLEKVANTKNSYVKIAIQITYREGLRVNEVCHLKAENINLEKRVIEVREGSKGNRNRDVPIRDKDYTYFKYLKEKYKTGYICPILPLSVNRGIRKILVSLGLSNKYQCTTTHSIRKLYAQTRYDELRNKGYSQGMEAFNIVSKELGHNENRPELFKVYVANRW